MGATHFDSLMRIRTQGLEMVIRLCLLRDVEEEHPY